MAGKRVNRRDFMANLAALGSAALVSNTASATAAEPPSHDGSQRTRPDILVIMPDQMRGDCLSLLGHPAVRTPNIDALAREGVLFRRAYTPVPSCMPARYALLTGLSPQASGVVGYAAKPIRTPTLPGLLATAGYRTVLVGRNMHQHRKSGSCGYQESILGSTYVGNDDYDKFLLGVAPKTGGIRNLVIDKMHLTYNYWQAKPWPLPHEWHPTEWIVDRSLQIVKETAPDKPLFLTTSFYAPHPPLFPPKNFFDDNYRSERPAPAHGDWVRWDTLSPAGDARGHRILLEGETLRRAQAGYFGLIDHIDAQIGPLIEHFKARSRKAGRPWIIVFIADHGEMLGDHGYFRKCEPYEGSANIPFIITASPELKLAANRRIHEPVSLEDVMPTLLSLAEVKAPTYTDGVNLCPILRGEKKNVRPYLHFEHAPCYSKAQAFHALTDGRYKYIWRPYSGEEQLFDLQSGPKEERDLAKAPASEKTLRQWRNRLIDRLADRPEGFVREGRLVPGQPYRPLNKGTVDIVNG